MCFSSWKLVAVIGITFYAYKLTEHVIGAPINLPDYINSHPAVTTLTVQPNTKSPYNDRLCFFFFRFLACHFKFRKDCLKRPALQLAQTYAEDKGINIKNFKGVGFNDLSYFEQRHNLRIHVYSLYIHPQDHSRLPFARLERRPCMWETVPRQISISTSLTTHTFPTFTTFHYTPKPSAALAVLNS